MSNAIDLKSGVQELKQEISTIPDILLEDLSNDKRRDYEKTIQISVPQEELANRDWRSQGFFEDNRQKIAIANEENYLADLLDKTESSVGGFWVRIQRKAFRLSVLGNL